MLSLAESTPPPTTSKPTAKKVKTKEKAQEKEKAKAKGNKKDKFHYYLIVQQCLLEARHLKGKALPHTPGQKENSRT